MKIQSGGSSPHHLRRRVVVNDHWGRFDAGQALALEAPRIMAETCGERKATARRRIPWPNSRRALPRWGRPANRADKGRTRPRSDGAQISGCPERRQRVADARWIRSLKRASSSRVATATRSQPRFAERHARVRRPAIGRWPFECALRGRSGVPRRILTFRAPQRTETG